ncbi:MAG: hypothetical protein M3081_18045 [Gemmatimonadota bacterium]|nr:hypothetical protein [Gemmatimonadota bacterium]
MIDLRTLGVLDLRGADGHEFRPVLQQPKRLALLVYLAVATPQRFHRRDTLLGLFWPELDTEHARAALRRSLYFLRRALGDGVLVGRGDEEVGLAAERLACDVHGFESALEEGRLAEAVELYKGALLPGFYVAGAPEFERWLDGERARLHDRALDAAWKLAEQLESAGDARGAATLSRRVTTLAPYDEPAHRRLITLLDRVGDRAAALRTYDELAKRLRADYELTPSAKTTQLVDAIRARRDAPAKEASTVTPAATPIFSLSATTIAVLPFSVRGSRDVTYLGEGIVDLLSTTLDGAGDFRTVDPRALLRHVAEEQAPDLDPARGRAIAERFGAGSFVLGSVVEAAGQLRVSATLYDARTGAGAREETRTEVQGASETGIFDMVDALARQLLAAQSRGPDARRARLAALTTESLPALKAYLRGESEFRAGRYFQALAEFQDAATEDSSFALAYFRLAAAAAAVANLELARESTEQAWRHRDRLSDHDRQLLEAQRAWLRGAADEAEGLLTSVVSTHVDDMEAWFLLGDVQFHHNPLRGRPMAEARTAFEHALRYDPNHVSSLLHLARIAAVERNVGELDTIVDRVLALSPAGDRALSARALRAFTVGNQIEKARVITALGGARGLAVGIAFTDIVLYARDFSGAYRLARLFTKVVRSPEEKALCHFVVAHLELTRGRVRAARQELRWASAYDYAWALELRALFAALPFIRVPSDEVKAVRDELERWDPLSARPNRNQVLSVHNGAHSMVRSYLLGLLAARSGDDAEGRRRAAELDAYQSEIARSLSLGIGAASLRTASRGEEALALLESDNPEVWYQHAIRSPFYSRTYERFMRAELLREAGRDDEARAWYRALGESSPYELIYLAPSALRRAELAERAGRSRAAAENRLAVAGLWSGADDELEVRE